MKATNLLPLVALSPEMSVELLTLELTPPAIDPETIAAIWSRKAVGKVRRVAVKGIHVMPGAARAPRESRMERPLPIRVMMETVRITKPSLSMNDFPDTPKAGTWLKSGMVMLVLPTRK